MFEDSIVSSGYLVRVIGKWYPWVLIWILQMFTIRIMFVDMLEWAMPRWVPSVAQVAMLIIDAECRSISSDREFQSYMIQSYDVLHNNK